MKKLVYLTMLLVLVLGTVSVAAQAPEKPAPDRGAMLGTAPRGGIEDISGSYAAWDNGAYGNMCASGGADYLCFNYHVESYTWSWPYGLQMHLPAGWNATNGYLLQYSCTAAGYPGTLTFTGGQDVNFSQTWYLSSGGDECDAVYCMDVTTGGAGPANWYINSDGYGGGVVDTCDNGGYYACGEAVMPPADVPPCAAGIYLSPVEQSGSACEGEAIAYSLGLFNNAGYDATFDLDYTSVFPISGPQSIYVANGTTGFFDVEVTIPCGGVNDTATVTASDATYSDSSWLISSVSAGGWGTIPASAPSWAGMGYPRDGCSALNAAGEWVTYIFGDTTSIFGFWGYNHATNSWFQPGAANTPADRWAPDWAYDAATNLCYVTGGANTPGGGNLTDAYVFDPVANAFTALGNFTSMRDFHNSWVGTIDGTKYLCIGGGVNASSVMIQATQCYDIAGGFWNAENAQMAAFPTDPFGAADGILHAPGGDQFWYIGGAINAGGAVTDEARYWDDADNAWHTAGNTGAARYRVEGDFLDGAYYQLGGSSGGFSPTTDIVVGTFDGTNWNWATTGQLANGRMDNLATIADGTIWSVDGYGATSANYVEKLIQCEPCSGDLTLTCGDFVAQPAMDPFGRIYVRWKVEAVDQDGLATAFVAVDANIWSPQGGPWSRTRWTHWDGFARFPWGSNYSGDWTIDVTNMTLQGYTFIDGANCTATGYW
jgi:hypothetical protein